ncbi:MAG: CsgG/HfaB family protein [Saprospiraceae bacterium]
MKRIDFSMKIILTFLLFLMWSGCGRVVYQPIKNTSARLGEATESTIRLRSLPPPKDKIVVAVYKFRDQTGQYKPSNTGASWSTAVTQGATTILIKALENSNWFVPIERENVSNLLNERKIIRSSHSQYSAGNGGNTPVLPALLFAGVILEGGIISYDSNVITGGAGLRYFGTGGGSQYRQDRVTIYLRAVSTSNGKILKTVYTSKTILSQAVDIGIFRFVKFGRLLEAETGYTYNEPSDMAVTEAIEKAVESLIIEGIEDKLWELKEPRMIVDRAILDYKKERKRIPKTDIFGKEMNNRRKSWMIGGASSSLYYMGDYPGSKLRTGIGLQLKYTPNPSFSGYLNYGLSEMATEQYYNADVSFLELGGEYRLLPFDVFTPYVFGGGGVITENVTGRFDLGNQFYQKVNIGGGIEYMLNNNVGIRASVDYNYIFSDEFDDIQQGKYNDFYWRGNLGLNFYFGGKIKGQRKFDFNKNKDDF